ncbi:hypothetical protein AMTR_s00082p00092190 [Amborella trichopoda]|uniref:Uncharacterized protein n=1 Tax=Amborella trichopoda TaxID=13333 RepID=W1NVP8_AMBTC|nr:hypothetical protein AMTR_s00082p00092190 [Amborella trichopoda]
MVECSARPSSEATWVCLARSFQGSALVFVADDPLLLFTTVMFSSKGGVDRSFLDVACLVLCFGGAPVSIVQAGLTGQC